MDTEDIESTTYKMIGTFAKTIEWFDLSPLEARLFAYLYIAEDSKTLDDMSDALGKSKTSMSTSIRSLSQLNLVKRVWKKGCRKNLYKANRQLFRTFITCYMHRWIEHTKQQRHSLNHLKKQLEPTEAKIHRQLEQMITFHTDIERFIEQMKDVQQTIE
ncbi:MAG TPA: transcriptional regulator [Bacillota bacterium]